MPAQDAASPRELWSWAFYDFANSGYATVVLTTIYSAFFVGVVAGEAAGLAPGTATLLWTAAIAAANLLVLLSAPVLGAVADYRACKKLFLGISSLACVIGTACLAIAGPGELWLALPVLILSAIAFATGENFIAAFLPEIANDSNMGRISGYGWSLGYFGGLLTLGLCLVYINSAEARGQTAAQFVPVTLVLTAVIFALAALPTLLWLRERARPRALPAGFSFLRAGFSEVASTLRRAAQLTDLFRFLMCLTVYQAGVATVIVVAAIYAQEVFEFDATEMIVLIMVVNLTAAAGAFVFGFIQDRIGSVPALAGGLIVWIAAIAVSWIAQDKATLWFAGNLIGLAMGSTQAGGRALVGQFTPAGRSGEFFGLWGLAARAAAIIGPLSYGLVNRLTEGNHQAALLSTLGFFVVGLVLLLSVNERRGIAARDAYQ
ncbi:MAG: MFS transporter [Pseudomonadota bacterium]